MKTLSGLVFLILAGTVLTDPVKVAEKCESTDIQCLTKAASDFFTRTLQGLSELDPLEVPAFDVEFDESIGVTFKLRNVNVLGLKKQKSHTFSYDNKTKKLLFAYEAELFIGADVVVDYSKKSKTFNGYFTSQPTVVGTFSCDLLIKKNDEGVDHFELGQEVFTYKFVTAPQLDWGEDTQQELDNDVAWKNQSEETFKTLKEKTIGEIVTKAFKFEIDSIRAALKVSPVSAVVKDYNN